MLAVNPQHLPTAEEMWNMLNPGVRLMNPQHKSVSCAALGKFFTLYLAHSFVTYDKNRNYPTLMRIKEDNANETIKQFLLQRLPSLIKVNTFKQV